MNLRFYSILYLCHIISSTMTKVLEKNRDPEVILFLIFSPGVIGQGEQRTVLPGHWYFKKIEIRSIKRDILKYRNITFTYIQIYPFPRHWEIPMLNIFKG